MGKSVNRIAIDFSDGSRAIVEKERFGDYTQNGNVKLGDGVLRSIKFLVEAVESQ